MADTPPPAPDGRTPIFGPPVDSEGACGQRASPLVDQSIRTTLKASFRIRPDGVRSIRKGLSDSEEEAAVPADAQPRRAVDTPQELAALAHPLRLDLLNHLMSSG